jgi:hypothetical protein
MIDVKGAGYQGAMLIFQMVDEIAKDFGYSEGAQDLIGEEACVNVEILQIVQERLIAQAELRRLAALDALRLAEEEVARAYQ